MLDLLSGFSGDGFMPHGHCYLWTPSLLWIYVISDSVIGLSYYSIPLALTYFVRKRTDLQFSWIFLLFSLFIFACGTTHFMSLWTIWHPDYWLDAAVKAMTAMASIFTAIVLWPLIPQALRIPSMQQLNQAIHQLEREVADRKSAEKALSEMNELLEQRVSARTAALVEAEHKLSVALESERAARAEAERLNHAKDQFLATLSHELRTPLNAIYGWTQLLQVRGGEPDMVAKGVEVIDRNVRLQTNLIEELLDTSAIISGKVRLDMQDVDLTSVINSALASITPAAQEKHIRVASSAAGEIGTVRGDPNRLQQVLWNVLTNAVKFTREDGSIAVELKRVKDRVEISVTDDGEGLDPDFIPMMFERFSQADSSTRRRHTGLGIGLSIVKTLTEMHGGAVRASSPGKDKGTTVTISLPLHAYLGRMQPLALPSTREGEAPMLTGIRVLVVDDDPDARDMVRALLDSRGAVTQVASAAAEARTQLERFQPDVLVCDISMPEEDGCDFLRSARASGYSLPAIALTALAHPGDRRRTIKAGYQAHLVKPLEPDELYALIADLGRRKPVHAE
jgi:signal transduction histidine kinase/CheY-like chemotaxis protein